MTTYRGMEGFVSLGGYLVGYPEVATAVGEEGRQVTFTAPQLTGVLLPGDTFRLVGLPGVYTVQTVVVAQGNALTDVWFAPGAGVGGFPAATAVLVTSHSIALTRSWSATSTLQTLETTVQGQAFRTRRTGLVEWEGTFEGLFDYGDAEQASLVNRFRGGKPNGQLLGVSFTITPDGPVTLYGAAVLSTLAVTSPGEDLVSVTGTWVSTGTEMTVGLPATSVLPGYLQAVSIIAAGPVGLRVRYTEPFDLAMAPLIERYLEAWSPQALPDLIVRYTEPFSSP